MAGKETREQRLRIIEERVNTRNADDSFDAKSEFKKSKERREAEREGGGLRAVNLTDPDDRSMLRGDNQESRHHKNRD